MSRFAMLLSVMPNDGINARISLGMDDKSSIIDVDVGNEIH
jgi:hypothetical protein